MCALKRVCVWDRNAGNEFERHDFNSHTTVTAVLVVRDGWERGTGAGIDGRMNDRREEGDLLS